MGVISRLYTFVNGNKAMAQQVNAEFDQLVNAHNSNEGVIATIQGQISTELATKKELADVTLGLIPDDTITQQKLAPALRDALPAQYVNNRIPTSADNYAAGHKIGDAWYIPDITLNNLVPTPLAINTADFTIQNANASASGSAVTLSCLGGFDFASFKRTITPVAGALYVLFADLKLTSSHVLTSLALNDQVIENPVKDTVYHVAQIVTAPTLMEIKAQALDGTALNGATVVIDKLTIVNMTADMDGVPFDKAGAEAYFQVNPVFLTHKLNNARTRWYCSDNGVWQSSSQLMDETEKVYGVETVDDALKIAIIDYSSYQAFCANVNATSLDSAFGKSNEGEMYSLGKQLAMYAWFKGDSKASHPFTYLQKKKNLVDALSDPYSYAEIILNTNLLNLIGASPYANSVYNTSSYKTNDILNVQALAVASGTPSPTQYNTINELFTSDGSNVVQSTQARAFATNNPHVTSLMGVSTICSDVMIANPTSLLAWLTDISVYRTAFANLRYNYNAMYANRANMSSILSNSAVRTAIASSTLIVNGPDVDANGTQLIGKTLLAIDNAPKLLVRLNLDGYTTANYTLTGGVDGNFTSSGLDCYVWSTGASAVSCTATTAGGGGGGTAAVGLMRYIKTN